MIVDRANAIHDYLGSLAENPKHAQLLRTALTPALLSLCRENDILDQCRVLITGEIPRQGGLLEEDKKTDLAVIAAWIKKLMDLNDPRLLMLDESGCPLVFAEIRDGNSLTQLARGIYQQGVAPASHYVSVSEKHVDGTTRVAGGVVIHHLTTGKIFKNPFKAVGIIAADGVVINSADRDVVVVSGGTVVVRNAVCTVDIIAEKDVIFASADKLTSGTHGFTYVLSRLTREQADKIVELHIAARQLSSRQNGDFIQRAEGIMRLIDNLPARQTSIPGAPYQQTVFHP